MSEYADCWTPPAWGNVRSPYEAGTDADAVYRRWIHFYRRGGDKLLGATKGGAAFRRGHQGDHATDLGTELEPVARAGAKCRGMPRDQIEA